MKRIIDSFGSTWSLVSRIPVRLGGEPEYRFSLLFLPLIGVVVAVIAAVTAGAAWMVFSDVFLVALTVTVVQYFLFNIFHFDGLLDSADALVLFGDREKRLTVLRDLKIGSFAFFSGSLYLAARLYLLHAGLSIILGAGTGLRGLASLAVLLFSAAVSGRAAAALVPCILKPARPDGLGSLLAGGRMRQAAAGFILSMLPAAALWILLRENAQSFGLLPLASFAAAPAAALLTARWYSRKIGGFTGDALGLAVEIGELLHLLLFYLLMRTTL